MEHSYTLGQLLRDKLEAKPNNYTPLPDIKVEFLANLLNKYCAQLGYDIMPELDCMGMVNDMWRLLMDCKDAPHKIPAVKYLRQNTNRRTEIFIPMTVENPILYGILHANWPDGKIHKQESMRLSEAKAFVDYMLLVGSP